MVAPAVSAAARAALVAGNMREEKKSSDRVQRNPEQIQNRILQARRRNQITNTSLSRGAANDNFVGARPANDNEQREGGIQTTELAEAQARVNRLRYIRAQSILAPEEETENQITKEEKQKPSPLRYSPAGATAVIKDTLDFTGIGSLPVIGTVVTFFCSVILFIFLIFAKKNGSISDIKFVIKRLLVVLITFIIEAFAFGVNFFPFETAAVVIVFFMDKRLSQSQINILQNLAKGLRRKPL